MSTLAKSQRNSSTQRQKQKQWHKQTEPFSPLRATNNTSFFLSTGRETNANWSNRINKDFYDLTYDVKYNLSKGKQDLASSPNQFRMKKKLSRLDLKKSQLEYNLSSKQKSSSKQKNLQDQKLRKHAFRLQLMKDNKCQNPEQIHLKQKQLYSTVETQGLCKFQFDKTISGRVKNRIQHHVDFQNQTMRQIYKPLSVQKQYHAEYQPTHSSRKRKPENTISYNSRNTSPKTKINRFAIKCHDFDSYEAHKVFQPREELDKFYQTQHMHKTIRPNKIKQTVEMGKITGRKYPPVKESSKLAYQQYQARKMVLRTANSHQISRSPRDIKFGRQVILATRGCYR